MDTLTTEIRGVEFFIEYNHTPEISSTNFSHDGDVGDEGSHEEVGIQVIMHNGEDLFCIFEDDLEIFENAVLADIHGNNY